MRSMLAGLDLVAIMAVGFIVTSVATFVTQGSDPNRVIHFAGISLPTVNINTLPIAASLVIGLFLVKSALTILITRFSAQSIARIEARSARAIAQSIFAGDLNDARRKTREDIMFAIQVGSPAAFNSVLNSLTTIIAEGTLMVMICIGFFVVNSAATLFAVLYFAGVSILIHWVLGRQVSQSTQKTVKGSLEANSYVSDLISVFRELAVLGLREKYIDRLYKARLEAARGVAKQAVLSGLPRHLIEASMLLGLSALATYQALTSDIVSSAATIGVFLAGGFRLTAALIPLQSAILSFQGTVPKAEQAFGILESRNGDWAPSKDSKQKFTDTQPKPSGPIGVTSRGISYTYPNSSFRAINQVSIEIKPGQQAALIGPSGGGKSTIADLISGVLSPSEGEICFQARDSVLNAKHLIGCVAYVPQKPGFVAGSIADNIALGISPTQRDESKIIESLERALLSDVIKNLPNGIHTNLGTTRERLSGGQLQRVGLARALYSEPGLLIMDEATSALDAKSEAEVSEALNKMRGEVTVVLIAHRLNTIQHSDVVFLVEAGTIIDSGTFKELQVRNSSISRLVELVKLDEI